MSEGKGRHIFGFQIGLPSLDLANNTRISPRNIDEIPLGGLYRNILHSNGLWNEVFKGYGVIVDD